MIAAARLAAFQVLIRVDTGGAHLPSALAEVRASLVDDRDQALTSEIAIGTLRWQGELDYLIARVARRPVDRLDREVLVALRMAVYQLRHLDRVPAPAIVSDAVDLTRRAGKTSAAAFVNGTLRTLQRQRSSLGLPARPTMDPTSGPPGQSPPSPQLPQTRHEAALDYLSITLSHPRWLARRWLGRLGLAEAEAWAEFNNRAAPLTLRVNRLSIDRGELIARLAAEGVEVEPTRFAPDGLVTIRGNPLSTAHAQADLFVAQDEASQLVAHLTDVKPGEMVLDVCASPGGKTTAMAGMMRDRGLIAAADVRPRRIRLLRDAVRRSGARSVRIVRSDATRAVPFAPIFDCVLVDAPCSGLGTIRREPDIRWRQREADLAGLASRQLAMLTHAAAATAAGGRVVYATCSSEPEENEEVVARFLESHPGFRTVTARPEALDLYALIDAAGHLRTSPTRHGLEAFFGAVMQRRA